MTPAAWAILLCLILIGIVWHCYEYSRIRRLAEELQDRLALLEAAWSEMQAEEDVEES